MLNKLKAIIQLIRVKQWIKNVFVLTPLLFSHKLSHFNDVLICLVAFFAFNFISSTVYVVNDIADIEADKSHPRKCKRPLASGLLSIRLAITVAVIVFCIGILISLFVNLAFTLVLILYFGLFMIYTFRVKDIVILDVFFIALGFIFRVVGGAVAISVEPSGWIVMTTFFLSLFLGFGKRRNELIDLEDKKEQHRKVLSFYKIDLLNQFIFASCAMAIMSYALYTLSSSVIDRFENGDKLVYTVPFVTYLLYRYIMILWRKSEGDPTEVILNDPALVISGILLVIITALLLYAPINFNIQFLSFTFG